MYARYVQTLFGGDMSFWLKYTSIWLNMECSKWFTGPILLCHRVRSMCSPRVRFLRVCEGSTWCEWGLVFSMPGYDEFYRWVIRERSYGFIINPLRTLNAGLHRRQREEIEFALYTLELIWRHAFSLATNSYLSYENMSDTSRFLTRCFLTDNFFRLSSCSTNFLFLLRYFFALLLCCISRWFSFNCSFMLHDTSISTTGWKLKCRGFRGYFIFQSLHQGTYFFFGFSLQIIPRFCESTFDHFL